jgi:Raf kinase inhibitor-like YbhB/YbcL family protein
MEIISKSFKNGGLIPSRHTCDGGHVIPHLEFLNPPRETVSFVLIMDDPDAENGMWDHWLVFNIPAYVREVFEGVPPEGSPGRGTSNNLNYFGPCPSSGSHRYIFHLYALNSILEIPDGADKSDIKGAMKEHILAEAEIIGTYSRER